MDLKSTNDLSITNSYPAFKKKKNNKKGDKKKY